MPGLISQSPPGAFDATLSDAECVQALNAAGHVEALDPADHALLDYFPEVQEVPATGATASSSRSSPASASWASPTPPTP
jgi:hypothetical protein